MRMPNEGKEWLRPDRKLRDLVKGSTAKVVIILNTWLSVEAEKHGAALYCWAGVPY